MHTQADNGLSPFAHGTDAIRRYPLVWGHYDLPALRRLGDDRLVVTLLREPRQRILSLYDFWRATKLPDTRAAQENIGPATAQRRSLLEFLRSPEALIRDYIDNCYVRRLAGRYSTGAGHDALAADVTRSLAVALDSLDRLAFVGITERMEETVAAMGQVLGFEAPRNAPRINVGRVTGGRKPSYDQSEPLTPEVEAELDRLTALDRVVYDRATQWFNALRARLFPAARTAGLTHR